jgi:hypothetical protein
MSFRKTQFEFGDEELPADPFAGDTPPPAEPLVDRAPPPAQLAGASVLATAPIEPAGSADEPAPTPAWSDPGVGAATLSWDPVTSGARSTRSTNRRL